VIKLIGIKRALILAVLLAANVAVAGIFFLAIMPMNSRASVELATVEGEIASLQKKINDVKKEIQDFKRNLPRYEQLKTAGFFSAQDRFQLERDLNTVQERAGIQGFRYTVSEVQTLENAAAKKSKSRVIKSQINIENPFTMTDTEFYRLVYAMMRDFPSHVRLQSFSIRRTTDLDNETLAKLRTQELRSLIAASAVFEWMTIVPDVSQDEKKSGWGGRR